MALVSGQISFHKNYDQDFTSSKEHGCEFQSTWVQNCFLIDFSRIPSSSANFFFLTILNPFHSSELCWCATRFC
jgi:hypothetical protein